MEAEGKPEGSLSMLITIADTLPPSEIEEIRTMLGSMRFEDGRATAGWSAKLVKDNEQAREGATLDILRERVTQAIQSNDVFNLAARPKALTPLLFSRYTEGKHYGYHVDNPLMNGVRPDVSSTLFLADPETYDGGELVIESASGEEEIKLPAGHLVACDST